MLPGSIGYGAGITLLTYVPTCSHNMEGYWGMCMVKQWRHNWTKKHEAFIQKGGMKFAQYSCNNTPKRFFLACLSFLQGGRSNKATFRKLHKIQLRSNTLWADELGHFNATKASYESSGFVPDGFGCRWSPSCIEAPAQGKRSLINVNVDMFTGPSCLFIFCCFAKPQPLWTAWTQLLNKRLTAALQFPGPGGPAVVFSIVLFWDGSKLRSLDWFHRKIAGNSPRFDGFFTFVYHVKTMVSCRFSLRPSQWIPIATSLWAPGQ